AADHLKSNIEFITKAVRTNHRAFDYANDSLKNNSLMKEQILSIVLNYEYATKNNSRFHVFKSRFHQENPLNVRLAMP
uniref:DUF4116 domain-containing protein n=1 Tax=uncultured Legionella sp. TaxID=210934 RepID=UPI00261E4115